MSSFMANRVADQVRVITTDAARSWLSERLIEPRESTLHRECGDNESCSAWIIRDVGERNVLIAYCEGGHGALERPRGLVLADDTSFGMDCDWHQSLGELIHDGWVPHQRDRSNT